MIGELIASRIANWCYPLRLPVLSDRSSVGYALQIAIFMTILEAISDEKPMQRLCI